MTNWMQLEASVAQQREQVRGWWRPRHRPTWSADRVPSRRVERRSYRCADYDRAA